MWSTMVTSFWEASLGGGRDPFLEDLAVPLRRLPEGSRRDAGGTVEGAHKIGQIAEAHLVGDLRDRPALVREQPRGSAQARAHQILVWRYAEHPGEQPQEVERADPGLAGRVSEVDRLMRICVEPERGLDRAA